MGPFNECPQFQSCSCNQCPLDPLMLERQVLPADREQRCHAQRSTRVVIAAKYPELPRHGLTLAEVARDKRRAAAKARFEALPTEQRAALVARLKKHRPSESSPDL